MNFSIIDRKRKEKRYTITEFCNLLGIDRTTYYIYMKNPSQMSVSTLMKFAKTLSLTKKEVAEILK